MERRALLYGSLALFASALMRGRAHARMDEAGRAMFAQLTDTERQMLRDAESPTGEGRCCDESDGVWAQEDTYYDENGNGHYKTSFVSRAGVESGWVDVPDEHVIKAPNKFGRPVVWYGQSISSDGVYHWSIRCYWPGPGA